MADVVRTADPEGDRTVFVMTKVDLAEQMKVPEAKVCADVMRCCGCCFRH